MADEKCSKIYLFYELFDGDFLGKSFHNFGIFIGVSFFVDSDFLSKFKKIAQRFKNSIAICVFYWIVKYVIGRLDNTVA